jgi:hypothetical protein
MAKRKRRKTRIWTKVTIKWMKSQGFSTDEDGHYWTKSVGLFLLRCERTPTGFDEFVAQRGDFLLYGPSFDPCPHDRKSILALIAYLEACSS